MKSEGLEAEPPETKMSRSTRASTPPPSQELGRDVSLACAPARDASAAGIVDPVPLESDDSDLPVERALKQLARRTTEAALRFSEMTV